MDGRNLGTYAANGNIMALDEMAGAANLDFGTFHPAAMAQVTLGGKVYGVPQFFDTPILIINNKVLAEANVSIDDVDTADWDKLRETATKLTVKEGNDITRLGFDPKLPEFLTLWARANGASLLSEDGKTSNLKDPKVAEALDFAASLIKDQAGDQATFQAFKDTWGFFAPENQVAENQLAFWPQEQWYLDVLSELSPDVDITVKPFNDRQGNPITQNIGGAFVIPESSANKEAGFEFARFMTSAEAWTIAAQAKKDVRAEQKRPFIGIYVANQQAMDQIFSQVWEPGDNEAYNNAVEVIRSAQANTAVTPANGAAAEFRRAYEDAVSAVLNDGTSAAEALATADEEAQGALDQAPTP
jgi:multiple sugar transport system substrate-binding protein